MHVVHQFQAGIDNTFYAVGDDELREGFLIDPFDASSVLKALDELGWKVTGVINTHGHWDHVGGNDTVRERCNATIYAHPQEEVPFSTPIGNTVDIAGTTYEVLRTPGHRPGHVCLRGGGNLFTGDTLFTAGCGNPKFGGNVDDLFDSLMRLRALDDDLIVYPGHNYAEKNLGFAAEWEPDNGAIAEAREKFREDAEAGRPHCSTIGGEKRWNPFFRLDSRELRANLARGGHIAPDADDRTVFHVLRGLRNRY